MSFCHRSTASAAAARSILGLLPPLSILYHRLLLHRCPDFLSIAELQQVAWFPELGRPYSLDWLLQWTPVEATVTAENALLRMSRDETELAGILGKAQVGFSSREADSPVRFFPYLNSISFLVSPQILLHLVLWARRLNKEHKMQQEESIYCEVTKMKGAGNFSHFHSICQHLTVHAKLKRLPGRETCLYHIWETFGGAEKILDVNVAEHLSRSIWLDPSLLLILSLRVQRRKCLGIMLMVLPGTTALVVCWFVTILIRFKLLDFTIRIECIV